MEKTINIKGKELGEKNLKVTVTEYGDVQIQQMDDFNDFVFSSIKLSVSQLDELIAAVKKV